MAHLMYYQVVNMIHFIYRSEKEPEILLKTIGICTVYWTAFFIQCARSSSLLYTFASHLQSTTETLTRQARENQAGRLWHRSKVVTKASWSQSNFDNHFFKRKHILHMVSFLLQGTREKEPRYHWRNFYSLQRRQLLRETLTLFLARETSFLAKENTKIYQIWIKFRN